jgi:hypothetical protein
MCRETGIFLAFEFNHLPNKNILALEDKFGTLVNRELDLDNDECGGLNK